MLDADLAELYAMAIKVLVQAIKRNLDRFPADFMFQLDAPARVCAGARRGDDTPRLGQAALRVAGQDRIAGDAA